MSGVAPSFRAAAEAARELRLVRDAPPIDADQTESRRCACCGSPMPKDIGEWRLAPAVAGDRTVGVLLACSLECDQQMEVKSGPH